MDDIRPEIDLYLKYLWSPQYDYWLLTLTTGKQGGRDVLLISNVDIDDKSPIYSSLYYFAILRPATDTSYKIFSARDNEFKISIDANSRSDIAKLLRDGQWDDHFQNMLTEMFEQKRPNFELCSPGMRDMEACLKWIRQKTGTKWGEYVILSLELDM